jgi:hypothetical protein
LIISQGPMASIILTTTAFKQNKHHIAVNSRVLNGHSARFLGILRQAHKLLLHAGVATKANERATKSRCP